METIKRHTRAARVVVWLEGCKPVCAGLAYKPIGCTLALSVTYSAAAAAIAACGAISVLCLYLYLYFYQAILCVLNHFNVLVTWLNNHK